MAWISQHSLDACLARENNNLSSSIIFLFSLLIWCACPLKPAWVSPVLVTSAICRLTITCVLRTPIKAEGQIKKKKSIQSELTLFFILKSLFGCLFGLVGLLRSNKFWNLPKMVCKQVTLPLSCEILSSTSFLELLRLSILGSEWMQQSCLIANRVKHS